jgi:hypothetical protein
MNGQMDKQLGGWVNGMKYVRKMWIGGWGDEQYTIKI